MDARREPLMRGGIHHIDLTVKNAHASRAFYESVLGFMGYRLSDTINRFVRRSAVGAAADYGDGIVRLVSDTIQGWDARTVTGRLENAVGRDLQYIRINGTLVGGLVGVAIHTIDKLL